MAQKHHLSLRHGLKPEPRKMHVQAGAVAPALPTTSDDGIDQSLSDVGPMLAPRPEDMTAHHGTCQRPQSAVPPGRVGRWTSAVVLC